MKFQNKGVVLIQIAPLWSSQPRNQQTSWVFKNVKWMCHKGGVVCCVECTNVVKKWWGSDCDNRAAFLAKIWQTKGTPAISVGALQSRRRPAPQVIFSLRVPARRRATLRQFSAVFPSSHTFQKWCFWRTHVWQVNNYCRNLTKGWVDLRNLMIPKKLSFHSLSFNTHQNEIPTPTPIKNKQPLNMHVSIRVYLFIHTYVFIYKHICVYVYISIFMYVYRWTNRWIDGYMHTTQRLHIYVNTI